MGYGFDIVNMLIFSNNSFHKVKVGRMGTKDSQGKKIIIETDKIKWHGSVSKVSIHKSLEKPNFNYWNSLYFHYNKQKTNKQTQLL